jgi:hypothetical protein
MTFMQPGALPEDISQQCPLCGMGQPASSRYPDYVCAECVADAKDGAGCQVDFQNTALTGGYEAVNVATGEKSDSHSCFIRGIECYADEAKFGGIVVRPSGSVVPLAAVPYFSVPALLAAHSAILDELKARKILRSRNNPTGDYAEWLVSARLGEVRYQIKGRRRTSDKPSTQLGVIRNLDEEDFDLLAAVVFDEDWSVAFAALIPHAVVREVATYRKHVHGHVMHLRSSLLLRPDVQDITAKLKTAGCKYNHVIRF